MLSLPIRFNSTLVRLRQERATQERADKECFNSTLVRLRPMVTRDARPTIAWFQFHVGSIKTVKFLRDGDALHVVSIPRWFD